MFLASSASGALQVNTKKIRVDVLSITASYHFRLATASQLAGEDIRSPNNLVSLASTS
jgi:hypothetical protein